MTVRKKRDKRDKLSRAKLRDMNNRTISQWRGMRQAEKELMDEVVAKVRADLDKIGVKRGD